MTLSNKEMKGKIKIFQKYKLCSRAWGHFNDSSVIPK